MAYATRNRAAWLVFFAGCANEAASMFLKKVIREPRPVGRCPELGTCGKFGMPSSHTQVKNIIINFLLLFLVPLLRFSRFPQDEFRKKKEKKEQRVRSRK